MPQPSHQGRDSRRADLDQGFQRPIAERRVLVVKCFDQCLDDDRRAFRAESRQAFGGRLTDRTMRHLVDVILQARAEDRQDVLSRRVATGQRQGSLDPHQPIVVPQGRDQRRHGRLGIRTDAAQHPDGRQADPTILAYGNHWHQRRGRLSLEFHQCLEGGAGVGPSVAKRGGQQWQCLRSDRLGQAFDGNGPLKLPVPALRGLGVGKLARGRLADQLRAASVAHRGQRHGGAKPHVGPRLPVGKDRPRALQGVRESPLRGHDQRLLYGLGVLGGESPDDVPWATVAHVAGDEVHDAQLVVSADEDQFLPVFVDPAAAEPGDAAGGGPEASDFRAGEDIGELLGVAELALRRDHDHRMAAAAAMDERQVVSVKIKGDKAQPLGRD